MVSDHQDSWAFQARALKDVANHPLSPLTKAEIELSAKAVKSIYAGKENIRFKVIMLEEPEKALLASYLNAERADKALPVIERKSFIVYYIRNTDKLREAIVNLSTGTIESNVHLGPEHHGPADYAEVEALEELILKDEKVQAELSKLQLPKEAKVVCDPWPYSSDGLDDSQRMFQSYLYARTPTDTNELSSNYFAFPLPISPVIDSKTFKIVRIDNLPTGEGFETHPFSKTKALPPKEYTPEHQKLRQDLKPLSIVQPKGSSFIISRTGETGEVVDWQKWHFRIGFNAREGMVLHNIYYDNRSLFYRIALSEMNTPYADPRPPFHRRATFDLGDAGAGIMANNLQVGCDCLGSIYYLDGMVADENGNPEPRSNAICIHEQDSGILWKHMDYRTGHIVVVRNRELVVQSIITVGNYDYVLAFIFNQAGELTYEIRATGIVTTQPVDEGVTGVPWGTIVQPGVSASHHQHLFSLRIDPAIDGPLNTLVQSEVHALPLDKSNPQGIGYAAKDTIVPTTSGLDTNIDTNRIFKITNPSSLNPANGNPVSYKIVAPPFQKIVAHPTSFHHKRIEFADHNIYVTKYREHERFASGKYTYQSRGGQGVRSWAGRQESITGANGEGDDIVVWVQFGLQHVVRVEDWPIMPAETLRVSLKPVNFFEHNPALDVPPSEQAVNGSVEIRESVEKHAQSNGHCAVDKNGGDVAGEVKA